MAKIERIPYHMLCWMPLLLTMIWYEWLEVSTQVESASTSGDNVIDTHGCIAVVEMVSGIQTFTFLPPHRTFSFTRIIFLLAKHICQLPTLSMRAWEKTNTIFCWEWFENANRKKLDIFTREQMSQLFICRSHFSVPKIASGQMSPMLKILVVS